MNENKSKYPPGLISRGYTLFDFVVLGKKKKGNIKLSIFYPISTPGKQKDKNVNF